MYSIRVGWIFKRKGIVIRVLYCKAAKKSDFVAE
jgi:hypothetical protein